MAETVANAFNGRTARVEHEKAWSLLDWLYGSAPKPEVVLVGRCGTRTNKIVIAVEVDDWPFPWGSLA